jgi:amidophosphoribosyltransferase
MGYGEECGVVAVFLKNQSINLPSVLQTMLLEVQHRGQTSSGFAVYSKEARRRLKSYCDAGKVSNLFKIWDKPFYRRIMSDYNGELGIGHVRYATSNVSEDLSLILDEAQPFFRRHGRPWKRFAIAFNGHLTNYSELKKGLVDEGYLLDTDVDTEVLMHLISLSLKEGNVESAEGVFKVFKDVLKKLDGSFSFVFINGIGDLVVARDKLGFRPLVIGENEDMICVASESKALVKLGITSFQSVAPGEIILVRAGKFYRDSIKESPRCAHCHFEYVYFSDTCSINDNILVDSVRTRLGTILGLEDKLRPRFKEEGWVVIPIPSTSIPSAVSYAKETGLPLNFSLIKGEVGRGFINSSSTRKLVMDSKYNLIPGSVKDKKVILLDDSIVRGETSERIVKLVRESGAKEVHLRVSEMPIKFPCCYGVDFPSFEELILGNFKGSIEEAENFVARKIGVDSMGFVSFEGLKTALGGGEDKFCFACLNGDYPTGAGCEFLKRKMGC